MLSVNGNGCLSGIDGQIHAPEIKRSEPEKERPRGKVTAASIRALLDYQSKKCALTGVELTPQTVSLDHITPLSEGGSDQIENCQLVHSIVNTMKGTMSNADFIGWCRMVSEHH